MTDFEHILPLWRDLESAQADYVLATIVEVQGSSYRRPGALMLLASDGRRAGTISGGCLEAEVAKKAWWLTESGPLVERYSTLDEDGDLPYGSGCGGVIFILLERSATARPLLETMHAAWNSREPLAIATVREGPHIGHRMFAGPDAPADAPNFAAPQLASWQVDLQRIAQIAFSERKSRDERVDADGVETRVWVDYRSARPGLWIFGAGDDTKPLLNMARQLGWFVAIADGRSHLATAARFPAADRLIPLEILQLPSLPVSHDAPGLGKVTLRVRLQAGEPAVSKTPGAPGLDSETGAEAPSTDLDIHPGDAAVIATHSYQQDTRILAFLLGRAAHEHPAYIGILGPQRRTREALRDAARMLGHIPTARLIEQWLEEIHGPTGLDLGADTPASIALSILAEIQKSLSAASALPLKQVRAMGQIPA
ncbi:MAG TPA: XdhC family protein [Terracidiphilus sp.]|jgi:xanthine/CO dehydrogenase XdhC/CoxF family maturation factor